MPRSGVERLGPDGLAVDEVRVGGVLGERAPGRSPASGAAARRRCRTAGPCRRRSGCRGASQHVGVAVVAVAAAEAGVVGDVAGRLLEVGHEPAPLEHLGEQVGGLLAGQVDAAELGHRVVAVLEEDPVVELLGPAQADGGVDGGVAGDVELAHELVEEQAPEALGRARVAGEQGALDHLGQVDQGEDRAVEVGEVPPEDVGLVGRELLGDVDGHGAARRTAGRPRTARGPRAAAGSLGAAAAANARARRVERRPGRATGRPPSWPSPWPRRARPGRPPGPAA